MLWIENEVERERVSSALTFFHSYVLAMNRIFANTQRLNEIVIKLVLVTASCGGQNEDKVQISKRRDVT